MEIGAEIAEKYLFKYSGGNSGVICLEPVDTGSFSCLRGVLPGQVHLCTVSLYTDLLLFWTEEFCFCYAHQLIHTAANLGRSQSVQHRSELA